MDFLCERVAYLKGLADGLEVDESTNEGKLLVGIIDVLEDIADAIVELDEDTGEISEYLEVMDEDLADMEDDIYEDDYFEDDGEIGFIETECPNCHEGVYIDEDLLYENDVDVVCPRCHEVIDFEEIGDYCCDDGLDDEE